MSTEELIPAKEFCVHYRVELSFVQSLEQSGLIKLVRIGENRYLDSDQLRELEKLIRLHNELDINLEGIEAVSHLLQRVEQMQTEVIALKNKLRLYENPD